MTQAGARATRVSIAWVLGVLLVMAAWLGMVGVLAPPAPPAPLRIAIGPWIGYEPFVLARENDWLGPRLRLVETLSNTESTQALVDGDADLAGVTLDEAIRLRSEGVPIRVVAVLSDSRGADALVARPGVAGLAGLRGRRVLVEDSAVGQYVLQQALAEAGLTRADVQVLQVQSSYLPARWREGAAEAAVVYEPMLSELRAGGLQVLFSTADHPGLVLDVLVAREDALAGHPEDVRAAIAAWDRAVAEFADPGRLPVARLTADGRLTPDDYRAALAGVALFDLAARREVQSGEPSRLARAVEDLAAVLREGEVGPDLRVDGRLLATGADGGVDPEAGE